MTVFLVVALCLVSGAIAQQQTTPVWIGVGFVVEKEIPSTEGTNSKSGIRITYLPYKSPAEKAGVLINDIIVGIDGSDFAIEPAAVEQEFRQSVLRHTAGDSINVRVIREKKVIDLNVIVEDRPADANGKTFSSFDAVERAFPKKIWPEEELASTLIDEFKIRNAYEDLRQRLARLSDTADRFRLSRVAYVQHEPFQLRTVAGQTFEQVAAAMNQRNALALLGMATDWLDAPVPAKTRTTLKTGLNLEQHLDQLVRLLQEIGAKREEAFQRLSADDRAFLENNCDVLFAVFADYVDLQADQDRDRFRRHARVLELAGQVDFVKLFEGAELLWQAAQDDYLNDLESALKKAWDAAGRPEGIFINRESSVGKILVGGSGSTWYTEDAAIVLDLAGTDFYTNNAGSPRGNRIPAALLVDFGGNDAYESTSDWTQSAARFGHALLIDREGNDEYVGRGWTQGAAMLGTALFVDESGNDIYRADEYAQGVAAWGIAIHIDYEGNDLYDAHLLSQGVGMAGGAGWLLDGNGNDSYYSKGKRPTAYGDPGIFDSWSQASAVGFRGLQSGGIALLYDGAGKDRYEAGNFSQGGGYYFGMGLLRDAGKDNDVYIGSRYSQGFAAHEAIGYFEENGGNDFYTTRHAVAQSASWDETITAFIDHSGDDTYEGGASYSQGASAHNGFAVFLDLGGRNRFAYALPQGAAGPNDYHGGTSFSLFVGADANGNLYTSKMKPSSIHLNGEYGLFVDLPTSIDSSLKRKSWQKLIR